MFYATISPICAQPVLTAAKYPPIGFKAFIRPLKYTNISPGNEGANQIWDFSQFALVNQQVDSNYYLAMVDPASTPLGHRFPAVNYCEMLKVDSFISYTYSTLNAYGFFDTCVIFGPDTVIENPVRPEILFPFGFHDTLARPFGVVNQDTIVADTLIYDGYGTLITPFATYQKVARIHINHGDNFQPSYEWWSSDPVFPLFRITSTDTMFYQFALLTGIAGTSGYIESIGVFPNPSTGYSTLKFNLLHDTNVQISLYDISGIEIKRLFSGYSVAGTNTLKIDNTGLAGGIYIITLYANGGWQRIKYMKL